VNPCHISLGGVYISWMLDLEIIRFAAFAKGKNAKRKLSFFPFAARVAGEPEGLKGGKPVWPNGDAALLWEV
jgi:hypothetical protein